MRIIVRLLFLAKFFNFRGYLHKVEGHDLVVGVIPAVPVGLRGPPTATVAGSSREHHRVAGVETALSADIVAKLHQAGLLLLVRLEIKKNKFEIFCKFL